ncbi:MAG TPA: NfeD family protein [Acidimicrobiia bacterium]|jgi:membrane protein implicated in regulation of membrane protease activity|nr:NfeD family protein [Acidimicrobiia bacterium]
MARHGTIEGILEECEAYWIETRVPDYAMPVLRAELKLRLETAQEDGRPLRRVTGRDPLLFAEAMASRYRVPPPPHPPRAPSERAWQRWTDFVPAFGWLVPVVGFAVLLMMFGPKEDQVDDPDFWRWLWLGIAVVLGVGEMVTAGFFMLPFAIGAAVAALLAWADVSLTVQLIVFISVSLIALFALRRFAWSDNEPSYPVGVKRFVNARGVVTDTIDPIAARGRVRLGRGETWSASSAHDTRIEAGTIVRVIEVRGSHLIVEPDTTSNSS